MAAQEFVVDGKAVESVRVSLADSGALTVRLFFQDMGGRKLLKAITAGGDRTPASVHSRLKDMLTQVVVQ